MRWHGSIHYRKKHLFSTLPTLSPGCFKGMILIYFLKLTLPKTLISVGTKFTSLIHKTWFDPKLCSGLSFGKVLTLHHIISGLWLSSILSHFNCVQFFVTLWTVACRDPLPMGFSRQEYWSGWPFLSPGALQDPGIEPVSLMSPAWADGFLTTSATWEAPDYLILSKL